MANTPALKNWRKLVDDQLNKASHSKEDILSIIYLCQDCIGEIQPVFAWVREQNSFVGDMLRQFGETYFTRFGDQPPPPPKDTTTTEVLLDTPESRKQAIREVALSITKPGDEVSDRMVLEELKHRAMKVDANNPTATISTILHGFKSQFSKVKDKRGVFKRQEQNQ